VSKFGANGNLLWTRQLGSTGTDESFSVSADGLGNVYVSGHTDGSLDGTNAGAIDAFIGKYNSAGDLLWIRQIGSIQAEYSTGVSADALGNVYLSCWTEGDLAGPSNGSVDVFVAKYGAAGNLVWTKQFGTSTYDYGLDISADGLGNAYVSGHTLGDLGGPSSGSSADAFLAKIPAEIPEPGAFVLGTIVAASVPMVRGRTRIAECPG
jgi:hypothetical protein